MGLDLKTKKGKWILAGGILAAAVVATAIAVPVALLVPGNTSTTVAGSTTTAAPDDTGETGGPLVKTGLSAASAKEIDDFNNAYGNVLLVTTNIGGTKVTVKPDAFLNRTDLAEPFTLPSAVTDIAANAFKGVKLPKGFAIPAKANIDATAFEGVTFDESHYWDESVPKAGAKVDDVENNKEWKAFVETYPDTLEGKGTKARAFMNRQDLPSSFRLPSFLTRLGRQTFQGARLPPGFSLPDSMVYLADSAFALADLPAGFKIPESVTSIGIPEDRSEGQILTFSSVNVKDDFRLPEGLTDISNTAFIGTTVPVGFTIPQGTKIWVTRVVGEDLEWSTSSNNTLQVRLPAGARWSDARGPLPDRLWYKMRRSRHNPNRFKNNAAFT